MVSPRPLPTPRRMAPRMPLREKGRMTSVTIPQRVPPSPSAASQTSRGAWAITSRLIDVMMGMMVTAQINPQAKIDFTYSPGARRTEDRNEARHGATSHRAGAAWMFEMSSRPQKPYTMLGTVASMSMTPVRRGFNWRGAYSLIIKAVANEIGAARTTAMRAMATEPTRSGHHAEVVRVGRPGGSVNSLGPHPDSRNALNPYQERKATTADSRRRTRALLPASTPLNTRSAPTGLMFKLIGTSSSCTGCGALSGRQGAHRSPPEHDPAPDRPGEQQPQAREHEPGELGGRAGVGQGARDAGCRRHLIPRHAHGGRRRWRHGRRRPRRAGTRAGRRRSGARRGARARAR